MDGSRLLRRELTVAPHFAGRNFLGLRQLGYVEGQSVIIEPRWPADIGDRVPELVRELLALNVQVIVVQGAIVPLVRRVIE